MQNCVICSESNFAESRRHGTPLDFRKEARATPRQKTPFQYSGGIASPVICLYREESASLYFNPAEDGASSRDGLESASLGNGE